VSPENNDVLARFVPDRGKLVVIFLGLVMFMAAAVYAMIAIGPQQLRAEVGLWRLALWAVLIGCPIFAADTLARIIQRTPTVVATGEGMVFRSVLGFSAPIPWREISGFRPVIMGKKPYLAIYLDDPVRTFARLGVWTRLMHAKSHAAGVPNIVFRAIQLGVSPAEAAAVLEGIRLERETG
jgi:hypothetical protein